MTRENTWLLSPKRVSALLREFALASGASTRVSLKRAEVILQVLSHHEDLGKEWGTRVADMLDEAQDVLKEVEG